MRGRRLAASEVGGPGQDPSSELLAEPSPASLSFHPESPSQGLAPGRPWTNVFGINACLIPSEPPLQAILLLAPDFTFKCPPIFQWLSTAREQKADLGLAVNWLLSLLAHFSFILLFDKYASHYVPDTVLVSEAKSFSHVQLFATPWTVAYQAPPSMGFSRQECWSGLPFPSPGDLPDPGIEPGSPALQAGATREAHGPKCFTNTVSFHFIKSNIIYILQTRKLRDKEIK